MTVNSEVIIKVIRDGGDPETLERTETAPAALTLPQTLPFTFLRAGIQRRAFDLQRFGEPWRELQFQLTATSGKLVLRSIAASAFADTVQLQS